MRGVRPSRVIAPIVVICAVGCSFDEGGLVTSSSLDGGARILDAGQGSIDAPIGAPDARSFVDAQPAPDARPTPDAFIPTPDAADCPGDVLSVDPSNFDECLIEEPPGFLTVPTGTWVLDTDTSTIVAANGGTPTGLPSVVLGQANGPDLRVMSLSGITIESGGVVLVRGSLALVMVSYNDINIQGELRANASLNEPGTGGAPSSSGTVPSWCTAGTGDDGTVQQDASGNTGGQGGGGGGHGRGGGKGSRVAASTGSLTPVAGGNQSGSQSITPLRGGCGGGRGANVGGGGGGGGGAIQLVADGTILIDGRIMARGGGGRGTESSSAGGGGGGAGGAVLLEAATIIVNGTIAVNGGGGGEGTRSGGGQFFGNNGSDGRGDDQPAAGGQEPAGGGGSAGGNGGNGGALFVNEGSGTEGVASTSSATGGGGGGGAVGRIHFNSGSLFVDTFATISPAEQ